MTDGATSPVFSILQNPSLVDYPGKLAGVFFIAGCNFRCGFCHNADLMRPCETDNLPWHQVEAICRRFRVNWVQGAVLTGGEPTLHPDLPAVVEKLRGFGFAVKLDTNGSRPRVLEKLLPLVDYVAMDIKCAPEEYGARTGFADAATLTESIRLIREHAADYEFRTTVIESWHTPETMTAIGEWVGGAKRHVLQAFVPREHLPDPAMRVLRETPADVLRALADILRRHVQCVEIRGGF